MYDFLKITHSIIRYIILLGGVGAIVAIGMSARARVKTFSLLFTISLQVQFIIGILLYFFYTGWFKALQNDFGGAMKDKMVRFFALEHPLMMIIAIAFASIGNGKVKKALKNNGSFRPALILFIIALLFILASIPWPFRDLGRGWI